MGGTLPVGAVVGDTFAILRRGWAVFLVLATLLLGLPQGLPWAVRAALEPASPGVLAGLAGVTGVAEVVLGIVFSAAATRAALDVLAGAAPSLAGSLRRGARLSTGALFIDILFGLGVAGASLLLVVPGAMLLCSWAVVLPAFVAEREGVRAAFARSRALTLGHRWRVFSLILLYALASFALYLPVLLFEVQVLTHGAADVSAGLENAVLDATSVLAEAGAVALYAALRRLADGGGAPTFAEAFE